MLSNTNENENFNSKLVNYNLEAFKIKKTKTSGVITHVLGTEVYREA